MITIKCPITWHDQIDWIRNNCKLYEDCTNWQMWQIGHAYIHFLLEPRDAVWFLLKWG